MADSTTAVESAGAVEDAGSAADPPRLLAWVLAAFHTALLVAVGVTALHLAGRAGSVLAGLRTEVGALLYLLLWATTWWTTRRWLADVEFGLGGESASTGTILGRAVVRGGANGALFLAGLLVVVVAPTFLLEGSLRLLVILAFAVLLGLLVAFVVGGVLGAVFGLLDLGLWRLAGWLLESGE